MNTNEKTLARHLFQNKILMSDGQSFEDLFTRIMNYAEENFQAIKPWGNIGDRKNDGYIKERGIYYQVYAPEDIRKNYVEAVNKLNTDFAGLKAQWNPINEFYFVVNDKYNGVNANCEKAIQDIKDKNGLIKAGFLTTKDIENILFTLEDDKILSVIGFIPDPSKIKQLDFSVLNEVIGYIMSLPLKEDNNYNINLPDFDEKIIFNNLSSVVAGLLKNGFIQVSYLEEYLSNNGRFIADTLRDKLSMIYFEEKGEFSGDDLFWSMVRRLSPKYTQAHQIAVIVIMAKYFETCDIFEDPSKGGEIC